MAEYLCFGQYKDVELSSIPTEYLIWLHNRISKNTPLARRLSKCIDSRIISIREYDDEFEREMFDLFGDDIT